MSEDFWLWAWGAAGAMMFAGTALSIKVFADPSTNTAADRRRIFEAIFNCALAIMTGAVTAQALASTVQSWADHIVHLPRVAAALIVGCSANFLWPKIVRKLGDAVDKSDPPTGNQHDNQP